MAKFTTRPSPNTSVSATATAASSEPYSHASTRLTTSRLAVTDPNGFIGSASAAETWQPYELAEPTTELGGITNSTLFA